MNFSVPMRFQALSDMPMLQITPQCKIWLATLPVDFRKGIDALRALCLQRLKQDPFSGALFVFRNRGLTALKILVYDGQGFWLCTKRLSAGQFKGWPSGTNELHPMAAQKLAVLLWNGYPEQARIAEDWRKIT